MGAIDSFLRRIGYARLDRYGLVLTPEDRVLSTRPAVLDDGLGGKIVGWVDGDLAAMELDRWGATPPAAARPVAAIARLQAAPAAPRSALVRPAPAAPAPRLASVPSVAPASVAVVTSPPQVVAAEPVVEEDDWEWEIAMARARAAADEVQEAAASIATAISAPGRREVKTLSTPPASALPDPTVPWPKTEPLGDSWADLGEPSPPHVMSPAAKDLAVRRSTPRHGVPAARPARSTVIPVPSLPVAVKPGDVRPAPLPSPRTRMARGTGREETLRTQPVAPALTPAAANDDQTSPYIMVPPEVRPTGFAHTKRVAAKHR